MERHLENCNKVGAEARKLIDAKLKKTAAADESPLKKIAKLSESVMCRHKRARRRWRIGFKALRRKKKMQLTYC
uniref:Uncharacterized protein n=1 Tax=Ditylenchus dipsaci TaxID=166011 RepID=A0A915E504_9BILA